MASIFHYIHFNSYSLNCSNFVRYTNDQYALVNSNWTRHQATIELRTYYLFSNQTIFYVLAQAITVLPTKKGK